MIFVRSNI